MQVTHRFDEIIEWRLSQKTMIHQPFCAMYHDQVGYSKRATATDCHMTTKLQSARSQSSNERSAHRGRVIILFALKDEANEIKRGEGS